MTKSEKKHWSEYKKKRQKEIEDAFLEVKYHLTRAIESAKELGKYEGRAQALLDVAKNYTASKTDDYYRLLENPCYVWKDGEKIPD